MFLQSVPVFTDRALRDTSGRIVNVSDLNILTISDSVSLPKCLLQLMDKLHREILLQICAKKASVSASVAKKASVANVC